MLVYKYPEIPQENSSPSISSALFLAAHLPRFQLFKMKFLLVGEARGLYQLSDFGPHRSRHWNQQVHLSPKSYVNLTSFIDSICRVIYIILARTLTRSICGYVNSRDRGDLVFLIQNELVLIYAAGLTTQGLNVT
jgi:hypothetical protein